MTEQFDTDWGVGIQRPILSKHDTPNSPHKEHMDGAAAEEGGSRDPAVEREQLRPMGPQTSWEQTVVDEMSRRVEGGQDPQKAFDYIMRNENYHGDRDDIREKREVFAELIGDGLGHTVDPHSIQGQDEKTGGGGPGEEGGQPEGGQGYNPREPHPSGSREGLVSPFGKRSRYTGPEEGS